MVKQIEKQKILAQFDALLKQIEAGSEIVIMDNQTAIAKIVKLSPQEKAELKSNKTERWTAEDFNLSLSDD